MKLHKKDTYPDEDLSEPDPDWQHIHLHNFEANQLKYYVERDLPVEAEVHILHDVVFSSCSQAFSNQRLMHWDVVESCLPPLPAARQARPGGGREAERRELFLREAWAEDYFPPPGVHQKGAGRGGGGGGRGAGAHAPPNPVEKRRLTDEEKVKRDKWKAKKHGAWSAASTHRRVRQRCQQQRPWGAAV